MVTSGYQVSDIFVFTAGGGNICDRKITLVTCCQVQTIGGSRGPHRLEWGTAHSHPGQGEKIDRQGEYDEEKFSILVKILEDNLKKEFLVKIM